MTSQSKIVITDLGAPTHVAHEVRPGFTSCGLPLTGHNRGPDQEDVVAYKVRHATDAELWPDCVSPETEARKRRVVYADE